ncbi:acyl carrier protein [Paenibacillus barcinonensis]|uniref:Acyl carrier protein n=1 Tax=Paenibacillus barcinonensis TaxID=198119 RepID=A0A2V4VM85_PAEBA|nr:phosphopantetheine-binding protein [Paenibacillus barcinonensis]PYE47271.1 acyl carrier protein/D-alanine--poly(phosphoribitol) ligase subunit 2 [Paenibacillus barcinonensis]QKS58179.1 acyl carrier protein [Paenibacillus barcinonensis]
MNETRIKEIITQLIGIEINDIHQNLILVGLDSMKTINLVVELEEEFDIVIDDNDLLFENFSTISRIVDLISQKVIGKELYTTKYNELL